MTESDDTIGPLPTEMQTDAVDDADSQPPPSEVISNETDKSSGCHLTNNGNHNDGARDDDTVGPLPSEMASDDVDEPGQKRSRGDDVGADETVGPLPTEMEDFSSSLEPPRKKYKRKGESTKMSYLDIVLFPRLTHGSNQAVDKHELLEYI